MDGFFQQQEDLLIRAGLLIRVDWMGGAVVGVLVLALHGWLASLYQLPGELVLFTGFANLTYACISFTLSQLRQGDRVPFLRFVAVANVLWALVCILLAAIYVRDASVFGLGQLISEAALVGCLGVLEWQAARVTPDSTTSDGKV